MSEHFSQTAARMLEVPVGERLWLSRICPRCGKRLLISTYREEDGGQGFECHEGCYMTKTKARHGWCNVFCSSCGCKCSIHLFEQGDAPPWHPSSRSFAGVCV